MTRYSATGAVLDAVELFLYVLPYFQVVRGLSAHK